MFAQCSKSCVQTENKTDTDPNNRLNQNPGQYFRSKLPFYSAAPLVQCRITCWTKLKPSRFLSQFIRFPPANDHSAIAPFTSIILAPPPPCVMFLTRQHITTSSVFCKFVSSSHTDTLQVRDCGSLVPSGAERWVGVGTGN